MNNVINMRDRGLGKVELNTQPVQVYDRTSSPFPQESNLYFPVYDVPLAMTGKGNFHKVDGYKALARADEDNKPALLAIVGSTYKTVQNRELFQAIENEFTIALDSTALLANEGSRWYDDIRVTDKMSYNGAMCLREYVFPNMRYKINDKSEIAFRTIVVNGFGGSSVKLYTGAIDFFCTNGMVRGQFDHTVMRHSKNLEIKGIADRVRRSIDVFYKDAERYRMWAKTGCMTEEDACNEAKEFFLIVGASERLTEKLLRQFRIEAQTHDWTIWALYSAMTYYATHDEGEFALRKTDNNHAASTMLHREETVRKWIDHDSWQSIAA